MSGNTRSVNFYDLCRICTMAQENKIKIFSAEGRNKALHEKMEECLNLVIDEKTDQLPKVVCQTCVQQLEAIMDFRKTCKNSQIMLSNLIATINVTQIKPKTAETNNSNQINSQIPIQIQSSPQQPQQQPQQQQQQLQQIHIPAGLQNNDLINSIMQGLQQQQAELGNQIESTPIQQYTITLDRLDSKGALVGHPVVEQKAPESNATQQQQLQQQLQLLQQQQQAQQQLQQNKEKEYAKNTLEEFLKLKPNIKVTPIKKEKPTQQQQQQQQQTDQYQNSQSVDENSPVAAKKPKINFILTSPSQNITQSLPQLTPAPQHATNTTNNTQAQPQIQLQLQSFAQQQLSQQLFSNLAPLLQQQPQLAAALPQLTTANTQPQIQLQLQPTFTDQQHNQQLHHSQQQLFSNLAPILQQQILQANPSAQTMLSPNKCFLPITIKDENSDQQIVAHIDAKNFILPTTYQLQMKLQPQIATVDGQPIMQLTPTSIPATLQLAPQALSNPTFQALNTATLQQQFLQQQSTQQPQTQTAQIVQTHKPPSNSNVQVTSQAIIKPAMDGSYISNTSQTQQQANNNQKSSQLEQAETTNATGASSSFKSQIYKITQQPGSNSIEITPTTNFTQQIMEQVQQQQQQKQQQQQQANKTKLEHSHKTVQSTQATSIAADNDNITTVATAHGGITVQRITSKATITKVTNPNQTPKMPVLQKNNVTISRITTTPQKQQQQQPQTQQTTQTQPHHQMQLQVTNIATSPNASNNSAISKSPQSQQMFVQKTPQQQQQQQIHIIPDLSSDSKMTIQQQSSSPPQATAKLPVKSPRKSQDNKKSHNASQNTATNSTNQIANKTDNNNAKTTNNETSQINNSNNQNPLQCPQCGRPFKKKEHLAQHVKLHAGVRPFKCTEENCDKDFSRKEHLLRHLVSHSGKKMYNCDICQKPFSRKDNLNKHRRIHTSGQSKSTVYTCEGCFKSFAVNTYYEEHLQICEKLKAAGTADNNSSNNGKNEVQQSVQQQQQQPQHHQQIQFQTQTSQNHPQQIQIQMPQQMTGQAQPQQQQIMHLQLPSMVTQDLANNTITITQSHMGDGSNNTQSIKTQDGTILNMQNFMQLGQAQFVNATTGQIMGHIKIEK